LGSILSVQQRSCTSRQLHKQVTYSVHIVGGSIMSCQNPSKAFLGLARAFSRLNSSDPLTVSLLSGQLLMVTDCMFSNASPLAYRGQWQRRLRYLGCWSTIPPPKIMRYQQIGSRPLLYHTCWILCTALSTPKSSQPSTPGPH
jgi:hypothetical protein